MAAGVFVCFTPMYGFHFLLAAAVAYVIQGNIIAALLATFIGNPLTFPIIAALCIELGEWILGMSVDVPLNQIFVEFSEATVELWRNIAAIFTDDVTEWSQLRGFFLRVFLPYVAGGIAPGILAGTLAYFLTVPIVGAYQKRRVKKLKERLKKGRQKLAKAEMAAAPARTELKGVDRDPERSGLPDP